MVSLANLMEWRYPGMANIGYSVGEDDQGNQFFQWWRADVMGREEPTQAELDSWQLPAAKFYKRRENASRCRCGVRSDLRHGWRVHGHGTGQHRAQDSNGARSLYSRANEALSNESYPRQVGNQASGSERHNDFRASGGSSLVK
jgi:hypothetical protein